MVFLHQQKAKLKYINYELQTKFLDQDLGKLPIIKY